MEKKVFYTYRSRHVQVKVPVETEKKEFESIQQYLESLSKKKTEQN